MAASMRKAARKAVDLIINEQTPTQTITRLLFLFIMFLREKRYILKHLLQLLMRVLILIGLPKLFLDVPIPSKLLNRINVKFLLTLKFLPHMMAKHTTTWAKYKS